MERSLDLDRLLKLIEANAPNITARERSVLNYIFIEQLKIHEIAELPQFHCTHQYISQLYKRAMGKLRVGASHTHVSKLNDWL
jgi:DNA-directed RNA polymerase specialized sigma subunit